MAIIFIIDLLSQILKVVTNIFKIPLIIDYCLISFRIIIIIFIFVVVTTAVIIIITIIIIIIVFFHYFYCYMNLFFVIIEQIIVAATVSLDSNPLLATFFLKLMIALYIIFLLLVWLTLLEF